MRTLQPGSRIGRRTSSMTFLPAQRPGAVGGRDARRRPDPGQRQERSLRLPWLNPGRRKDLRPATLRREGGGHVRRGTRAQRQHRVRGDAREHRLRDRRGLPAGVLEHAASRMRPGRYRASRFRYAGRRRDSCRHREHAGDQSREVGPVCGLSRVDGERGPLLGQHGRYSRRRLAGSGAGHCRSEHRLRGTRVHARLAQQPSRAPSGAGQAVSGVREHEGRGQQRRLSRIRHRLRRHQSGVAATHAARVLRRTNDYRRRNLDVGRRARLGRPVHLLHDWQWRLRLRQGRRRSGKSGAEPAGARQLPGQLRQAVDCRLERSVRLYRPSQAG